MERKEITESVYFERKTITTTVKNEKNKASFQGKKNSFVKKIVKLLLKFCGILTIYMCL